MQKIEIEQTYCPFCGLLLEHGKYWTRQDGERSETNEPLSILCGKCHGKWYYSAEVSKNFIFPYQVNPSIIKEIKELKD